jgi:hypothetical protein
MSDISPFFTGMLFAWGGITIVFVILMIYRSLFSMREDDLLFLTPGKSLLEDEQADIRHRIDTVTPYTKGFGWVCAVLTAVIAVVWAYRGFA